jgi:hypothetical protein
MTIAATAGPVPGASNSSQGSTVTLSPNVPTQIQVDKAGVTLINESGAIITLGSDAYFAQDTVNLPVGASLPWPPGGVLYAMSVPGGSLVVMQGLYNYWNPATTPTPAGANTLFNGVVNLSGIGNGNTTVTLPSNAKTLLITIPAQNAGTGNELLTDCKVIGLQSTYAYRGAAPSGSGGACPPYLRFKSSFAGTLTSYLMVVPVMPLLDTQVSVQFSGVASFALNVEIAYDTSQYKEDTFYNGVAQSSSSSVNNAVLVNGPARILALSMSTNGASADAIFDSITGASWLYGNNPAGTTASYAETFPPNSILPAGHNLTLSSVGNAIGVAAFAYP